MKKDEEEDRAPKKEKESGSAGSDFGSAAIKGNHLKLLSTVRRTLIHFVAKRAFTL